MKRTPDSRAANQRLLGRRATESIDQQTAALFKMTELISLSHDLGDSLQVMASLAEREGLRGRVQCIYVDPPYCIEFDSNFQWSTADKDVKDGKVEHITREPAS